MMRSMTAYGRGTFEDTEGIWTVEIQCINRKVLDISVRLPQEFLQYDQEVRKLVGGVFSRGQVNIFISFSRNNFCSKHTIEHLKKSKDFWSDVASNLGFNPETQLSLQFLLSQEKVAPEKWGEGNLSSLLAACGIALDYAEKMKICEGTALKKQLVACMQRIEEGLESIRKKAPVVLEKHKTRLIEALQEVGAVCDERVLREVVLFADKIDIEEEITRLLSHKEQFFMLIESKTSKGKTLDFLIQEMQREINTLSVKFPDPESVPVLLMMKTEAATMREQIHNIE